MLISVICFLFCLQTTLEADMQHDILKCTPILETRREKGDSLSESNSSFSNQKYKRFQLNSTYLTETPSTLLPSLPAENKHNGINNNTTFTVSSHCLSAISPPKNYCLNLSDSTLTNTTIHEQDILKNDTAEELSKSDNEILNYKNETLTIPSSLIPNEENMRPAINKFATITKKPRDFNLTSGKSSLTSLRLQSQQSPFLNSTLNSKSNATFTKSIIKTAFCKSTDGINGERESGTEDDQMSSASDSSFSSGTNLPRSVTDLQTIAKQQEESEYNL